MLYDLATFGIHAPVPDAAPDYWYRGRCPRTGAWHRLPRTARARAVARGLMEHLAQDERYCREGKMYGVLLVQTADGAVRVLQAFSGLLAGAAVVAGWVPPVAGATRAAIADVSILAQLDRLSRTIATLQQLPEREQYADLARQYQEQRQALAAQHRQHKRDRQQQRQHLAATHTGAALAAALAPLDQQSRLEGIARRRLKQQQDADLAPLQAAIAAADQRLHQLKQQRRALSRQHQAQLHAAYELTNFSGETASLTYLYPSGPPTGTGDCAAPKLLHYAASHGLTPLALAEFWWGPPPANGDKQAGQFYGACADRCQPIMGFLLSGCSTSPASSGPRGEAALPVLYQDDWLIAIDKPAGLLTVPGRTRDRQDCVLHRLPHEQPQLAWLQPVHRLDQDTSGIVLLARDPNSHRHLSRQFQRRQVTKTYVAVLTSPAMPDQGVVDLPLWGDPAQRPRQHVDHQRGKSSLSHFRVLQRSPQRSRVAFIPVTGRTHQLRVHAAHPHGLNAPIVGDRLYGPNPAPDERLHLHATTLRCTHPVTQQPLTITSSVPF